MPTPDLVTPGRRLTTFAEDRADGVAAAFASLDGRVQSLTWGELEASANRLAGRLAVSGAGQGDFVAIGLPNSLEHLVAAQAVWKLGACAMPVGHNLPVTERDALLAAAQPAAEIAEWPDRDTITPSEMARLSENFPDDPPSDDRVPQPYKAIGSGGSTGRPKLIVSPGAFAYPEGAHPLAAVTGIRDGDIVLSPGPLYHNQAFLASSIAIYTGATAVVVERFRTDLVLRLIEDLGVSVLNVVPTMMGRLLRDPEFERRDLSSLRVVLHMAAPCPEWVKRGWIERVGPEHVLEMWAATELTGITVVRGDQWLARPGTVGQPVATEIRIIGPDGRDLPPGEVGEIYSRMAGGAAPTYEYRGAHALPEIDGGFTSVGDMGWLDEDGFLYLADRRTDLIITGGANVYPAEVEGVLSSHPGVDDVVVVGLPDHDLGARVHAIVQPKNSTAAPEHEELRTFCLERLAKYKCPRDFEFVSALPRAESGKIRRGLLREERVEVAGSGAVRGGR